jgi:hypothetical protein
MLLGRGCLLNPYSYLHIIKREHLVILNKLFFCYTFKQFWQLCKGRDRRMDILVGLYYPLLDGNGLEPCRWSDGTLLSK